MVFGKVHRKFNIVYLHEQGVYILMYTLWISELCRKLYSALKKLTQDSMHILNIYDRISQYKIYAKYFLNFNLRRKYLIPFLWCKYGYVKNITVAVYDKMFICLKIKYSLKAIMYDEPFLTLPSHKIQEEILENYFHQIKILIVIKF